MKSFFRSSLLSVVLFVGIFGCSGGEINDRDPSLLSKEAEEDISNDHYQLALDKLRIVKNKFPYSKHAIDAQLRIADVYFLQELYGEAALTYETFRDLHPKHERVAYAMFRIGKSHFLDAPSNIARDLTAATKALNAYKDFVRRFPDSTDTPEANKDIAETRKILAEKELYIANFYFREDQHEAARARLKKIVDNYSDTEPAREAQAKLTKLEAKK